MFGAIRCTIEASRMTSADIGSAVDEVHISIFFFQAEDGIRDYKVTGVQTCALPICPDLIHLEKAHDLPEPPDLSGGAPYFLQKSAAADWPGYSGQVSEASAEKGKRQIGRASCRERV